MQEIFEQYGDAILVVILTMGLIACMFFVKPDFALGAFNNLGNHVSDNSNTVMTDKERQSVMVYSNALLDVIQQTKIGKDSEGYDIYGLTGVDRVKKFNDTPDSSWTDVTKYNKGTVYAKIENNRLKLQSINGKVAFNQLVVLFQDCRELTDVSGLTDWDVSNVTKMDAMFHNCKKLTDITPLKNWDVNHVKNMSYLFGGCSKLTDLSPLKNWNVSNVTNMYSMFGQCRSLTDISCLKDWSVSNVTDMSWMFSSCKNLTDISGLVGWNVSNVTKMTYMFTSCVSLKDINSLKDWNVSNVTDTSSMFSFCKTLTDISGLGNWNIANIKNMGGMFQETKLNQSSKDLLKTKFWR